MHLRTFSAGTMADALVQVKSALGTDAVILHTRTYSRRRWLGLRKQEVVEITAGKGLGAAARSQRRSINPKHQAGAPHVDVPAPAAASLGGTQAQQLMQQPAVANAAILGLSQDVTTLKQMVLDLVKEARQHKAPQVPEELFDHYLNLIQNQVAEELAQEVIKSLQSGVRAEHLRNADYVRDKLAEHLERMLPVSGPIVKTKKDGPHVVALIGPTGVGKTTTIAKLAANLKLREGKRVGLITIDTYRIAAVDQLKKYADIIGSPLKVVGSPEDLRDAIHAMNDCEFVLIDTAGRSPSDTLKLNELKNFLALAKPDEVHLVISTTSSEACIESAINRFSDVRVDKIIFTKLDEAVHVGVVLNVIRKVGKSLSYVTTGQDVPDDIEVGRGRKLARLILGTGSASGAARGEPAGSNA